VENNFEKTDVFQTVKFIRMIWIKSIFSRIMDHNGGDNKHKVSINIFIIINISTDSDR